MRFSILGIITAIVVGLIPLLPRLNLFYGAVASKYFLLILLVDVLLLIGGVLLLTKCELQKRNKPLFLSIVGAFSVYIVSSVFGVYFQHSLWSDVARTTGAVFFAHMVLLSLTLSTFLRKEDWSLIRLSVVGSSALFALLTFVGTSGLGASGNFLWFDLSHLGITFGNDTFAGMYLVLAFFVGLIELVRTKQQALKYVLVSALGSIALSPVIFNVDILLGTIPPSAVLYDPALLLGSARASSVALLVACAVLMLWATASYFFKDRIRRFFKTALLLIVGGAVMFGSFLLLIPGGTVQTLFIDESTEARVLVWNASWEAFQKHPVLGYGPENFDRAQEQYFNPALYVKAGTTEVWFDRAHNVTLDTLVQLGLIGLLAVMGVVLAYVYTIVRARQQGTIGEMEMIVLAILPFVHFIQLQTAFDVVPTFALLSVVGGYALWLEQQSEVSEPFKKDMRRMVAAALIAFSLFSFNELLIKEYSRQWALVDSLSENNPTVRRDTVELGLSRTSDFEGLHRSANLFVESVFTKLTETKNPEALMFQAREQLAPYIEGYERYLYKQPEHYRARMNYAYLLLVDVQWGGNRADEALSIIEASYQYSPNNPLTPVLHAMALVYQNDILAGKSVLLEAKATYPGNPLVVDALSWISKQTVAQKSFLRIANI